jgi:hypothetical protein
MNFFDLYKANVTDPDKRFIGDLLALDPGETTGYVHLNIGPDGINLKSFGQISCAPLHVGIDKLEKLIDDVNPKHVVYEDYRVYTFKSASHSNSELHTPKLIGAIEMMVRKRSHSKEMAQQAKMFVTDQKLEEWGYWWKGKRHARDAMRHALYFLMFRASVYR